jgi:hypothetical protein
MKKDDTLLIKINKQYKKRFIELCKQHDTTASRELRKHIERYVEMCDKLK